MLRVDNVDSSTLDLMFPSGEDFAIDRDCAYVE